MTTQTYTSSRNVYDITLRAYDAVLLPVAGLIRRHRGTHIDDFGTRRMVIISSTEHPDSDGQIIWHESVRDD
jgi:hypothetical protein